MPQLKQLSCSIEWSDTRAPFQEYGTIYGDGLVETFIVVPNKPQSFAIHLRSIGFVNDGLSAIVFIDGMYQTNRNRVNLRPSKLDARRGVSEIDWLLRQKEKSIGDGVFMGREWRFDNHNIIDNPPDSIKESHFDLLGTIEVLVLRCRARIPEEADESGYSSAADSDVLEEKGERVTIDTSDNASGKDGSIRYLTMAGSYPMGNDGTNEQTYHGFDGSNTGRVRYNEQPHWRPPTNLRRQQSQSFTAGPPPWQAQPYASPQSHSSHDPGSKPVAPEKHVRFDLAGQQLPPTQPPRPPSHERLRPQMQTVPNPDVQSGGGPNIQTTPNPPAYGRPPVGPQWYGHTQPLTYQQPNVAPMTTYGALPQPNPNSMFMPLQSQPSYPIQPPLNVQYPQFRSHQVLPLQHPPWALQPPHLVYHPPYGSQGPFWPNQAFPYSPYAYNSNPSPATVAGSSKDSNSIGGNQTQASANGHVQGSANGTNDQFNWDAGVNGNALTMGPNNDVTTTSPAQGNGADNGPNWDTSQSQSNGVADWTNNNGNDTQDNSNDQNGIGNEQNHDTWATSNNNDTSNGNDWNKGNNTANDDGNFGGGWNNPDSSQPAQNFGNAQENADSTGSTEQSSEPLHRALFGPHGKYLTFAPRRSDEPAPDAEEEPRYDVPKKIVEATGSTKQVLPGSGYMYWKKRRVPQYLDSVDEPYARFVFKYRTKEQLEKEIGIKIDVEPTGDQAVQELQAMDKQVVIEMLLRAKSALGGKIPSPPLKPATLANYNGVSVDPPDHTFLRYKLPELRQPVTSMANGSTGAQSGNNGTVTIPSSGGNGGGGSSGGGWRDPQQTNVSNNDTSWATSGDAGGKAANTNTWDSTTPNAGSNANVNWNKGCDGTGEQCSGLQRGQSVNAIGTGTSNLDWTQNGKAASVASSSSTLPIGQSWNQTANSPPPSQPPPPPPPPSNGQFGEAIGGNSSQKPVQW